MDRVLVTGGAGFIGSHIVDLLLDEGYEVRVIDNLDPQVHGVIDGPPSYLNKGAEFIHADVRDRTALDRALAGVNMVSHQAARVGVAQSMYEIESYVHGNDCVTGALLQAIVDQGKVEKLVAASSMSIYGEGAYRCAKCGPVAPRLRSEKQLKNKEWELNCPNCGGKLDSMPTNEDKPLFCESVYGLGKRATEDLSMVVGKAYGIPTVAFRYFNIYGPRQALGNPYTGLLAIVASRYLNKKPPIIFEDGLQTRDFTNVKDAARANLAALRWQGDGAIALNMGTGHPQSVLAIVETIRAGLGGGSEPVVRGDFRVGDIRHCHCDPTRAEEILGFKTSISFQNGIQDFLDWASRQEGVADLLERGLSELEARKLIK